MAFEKKEGQGSLFFNEQPTDRHPIYKGYVVWKGEEIPLALWAGKEGSKVAFTIKAEAKQPQTSIPMSQRLYKDGDSRGKSTFTPRNDPNITSGLQKQNILPDREMDDEIPF